MLRILLGRVGINQNQNETQNFDNHEALDSVRVGSDFPSTISIDNSLKADSDSSLNSEAYYARIQ